MSEIKYTTMKIPASLLARIKKMQTRAEPASWDVVKKLVDKYE